MNIKNIKKAVELDILLDATKKALKDLNEKLLTIPVSKDNREYKDGPWNLCIAEHGDGSGGKVVLNRYFGNRSLLEVIKTELERQVAFFEKEIELL